MSNNEDVNAAMNTLSASDLKLFFVRIFGKKTTRENSNGVFVFHEWRGRRHLTSFDLKKSGDFEFNEARNEQ